VSALGLSLNLGLGTVMGLLHVAKAALVAAGAPAWRRNRGVGAVCLCAALLLVAVSFFNAWSLLERQRSVRVADVRTAVERADIIREELRSVRERVALLGWRTLATVEAELAAERHSWIWDTTTGCTKAESGTHRQFCARAAKLEGARAEAAQAESLRQREAELTRALLDRPALAEHRHSDLVTLAGWFGSSLASAEMLQALMIAAVIELTEVVLFGLAGFFAGPSASGSSVTPSEGSPVQATARSPRGDRRRREGGEEHPVSPQARARDADGRKATADADSDGHDETCWRAASPSRPRDDPRTSGGIAEERRRAVDAFAASLRHGTNLRAAGSELFDLYAGMRAQRGWPPMARNVFGQLLKAAIEAIGGRKLKSSRQLYEGVAVPPVL
jgi:hypothetical protein